MAKINVLLKLYGIRGGLKGLIDLGSGSSILTLEMAKDSLKNLVRDVQKIIDELEK